MIGFPPAGLSGGPISGGAISGGPISGAGVSGGAVSPSGLSHILTEDGKFITTEGGDRLVTES